MFFIPGGLISILTFPGVIVHEIAHQIFCRICRVSVFEVCYFRRGNPAGYVVHEEPKNSRDNVIIGIGPFLINTIVGALIAFPAAIPILKFGPNYSLSAIGNCFLIWIGVSIAMHSFPSTGNAKNIWQSIKSEETSLLTKIIGTPIVMLIYIGAAGSVIWLDLIYGVAVVMFIPNMIVRILA